MSIGCNGKRATFNGRSPDKPAVEVKNSLTRVGKEFQVTARELQKAIERNPALKMALLMALGIVEKTGKGDAKGVIIEILMALPPAELAKDLSKNKLNKLEDWETIF